MRITLKIPVFKKINYKAKLLKLIAAVVDNGNIALRTDHFRTHIITYHIKKSYNVIYCAKYQFCKKFSK